MAVRTRISTACSRGYAPGLSELMSLQQIRHEKLWRTACDALTAACNGCHQATNFGFNVVRQPQDATWFGNQDFAPGR